MEPSFHFFGICLIVYSCQNTHFGARLKLAWFVFILHDVLCMVWNLFAQGDFTTLVMQRYPWLVIDTAVQSEMQKGKDWEACYQSDVMEMQRKEFEFALKAQKYFAVMPFREKEYAVTILRDSIQTIIWGEIFLLNMKMFYMVTGKCII